MRKLFFVPFILISLTVGLFAQQGNNPFELPDRTIPSVPSAAVAEDTILNNPFEVTTDTGEREKPASKNNPFEVNENTTTSAPPVSPGVDTDDQNPFEIKKNLISPTGTKRTKRIRKPKLSSYEPLSGKFKLWMTILLVTILTVLVNVYKSVIGKVYRSFLNDNFLKMVHRDYGTITMIPYLILYGFSLIVTGVFLFVVLNHYEVMFISPPILCLLSCIGGVFALFMTKHLLLYILGSIFPIAKEIEQYSFTIIIFGISLAFFLLPAILLISYAPPNLTTTLIYGIFMVISLVYLYRILRSLFIGLKYISLHKFHFFVYLCTIEIAPLLVLIKLATAT